MAFVAASVSSERAHFALQHGQILLPKPRDLAQILDLLALLQRTGTPRIVPRLGPNTLAGEEEDWILDDDGLRTPTGFIPLGRPSRAILNALMRSPGFVSSTDLARALDRRDYAGPAMVRRRIADTRRALGEYSWLIESLPKHGYRLARPSGRGG
jgi:hypothetical protein